MKISRRDLTFLLPALATAQTTQPPTVLRLPSSATRWEDTTRKPNGPMTARQYFKGQTHSGFLLDLHETELVAGEAPHAPHQHVHEEMLLIREGQLDVTIEGKTTPAWSGIGRVSRFRANARMAKSWQNGGPVFRTGFGCGLKRGFVVVGTSGAAFILLDL